MSSNQVVFLYGSQTGNAESIAKGLHNTSLEKKIDSHCYQLNDFEKFDIMSMKLAVIICSTTGDGDIPDNAAKFFRFIKKKTHPDNCLSQLQFALLALGDTNYENFCNAGKKIHARLLEMGAKEFYARGLADDANGIDRYIDPWIEGLWGALSQVLLVSMSDSSINLITPVTSESEIKQVEKPIQNSTQLNVEPKKSKSSLVIQFPSVQEGLKGLPKVNPSFIKLKPTGEKRKSSESLSYFKKDNDNSKVQDGKVTYSSNYPFISTLSTVTCLTSDDAVKRTISVELDIEGSEIEYVPGDSFGVICPNESHIVNGLINYFGLDSEDLYELTHVEGQEGKEMPGHLSTPFTIYECLSYGINLSPILSKTFVKMLGDHAQDSNDQYNLYYLCSRAGSDEFQKLRFQQPTVLDILDTFPSCKISIERLLEHLPPLQPRSYSVCSSPLQNPTKPRFAFNIVEYSTPEPYNQLKKGLCTNWINDSILSVCPNRNSGKVTLQNGLKIPIFLKPVKDFLVVSDVTRPIIMIGPGTGVAPFIGFLQQRKMQSIENSGECWLFYGCRNRDKDFLFKEELESLQNEKTKLFVAYSREDSTTPDNKYVQNIMKQQGAALAKLMIEQSAYIFICGDAKGMAKDVDATIKSILIENGGLQEEQAKEMITSWNESKRYVRDIWG